MTPPAAAIETVPPPAPVAATGRWLNVLKAAVVLGILLRLGISAVSLGTGDARTWRGFGQLIAEVGLFDAYRADSNLNHPPLMALWARAAWGMTDSPRAFSFVFRLLPIAADVLACVVLVHAGRRRGRPLWGWVLTAGMALNPVSILIGAYHCNTDNVYAAFSLLAACMLVWGRPFAAGLALGAALNVKIIPVILVPPLLAACGSWRAALRMAGGLAITAIPFVPVLIEIPKTFKHNAVDYNSAVYAWGVMYVLTDASYWTGLTWLAAWEEPYRTIGRRAILVLSALIALGAVWRLRRWDATHVAAFVYAAFLVVTPGFGVQYTACVVPVLILAFPRHAAIYSVAAGGFLLANYAFAKNGRWPKGEFGASVYSVGLLLGMVAWLVLLRLLIQWAVGLWHRRPAIVDRDIGPDARFES